VRDLQESQAFVKRPETRRNRGGVPVARQLGHSTEVLWDHYEHLISELGTDVIDPERVIREARGERARRLAT
jgi:hypothetical protein